MKSEILYLNGKPALTEGNIHLITKRGDFPGELRFTSVSAVHAGDSVSLFSGKSCVFRGKVFSVSQKAKRYSSVAFDLLRYFRNKTTFVFENRTASEVIRLLCLYGGLPAGTITDTKMKISSEIDDARSLFSIAGNALTLTASAGFGEFVLYDDCGCISLMPSRSIAKNVIISPSDCSEFEVTESIDEDFYNSVRIYETLPEGRKLHVYENEESVKKYGRIVFTGKVTPAENAVIVAKSILNAYSKPQKTIKARLCFDIPEIRSGAEISVYNGGEYIKTVCESAEHIYGHMKNELLITLSYSAKEDRI